MATANEWHVHTFPPKHFPRSRKHCSLRIHEVVETQNPTPLSRAWHVVAIEQLVSPFSWLYINQLFIFHAFDPHGSGTTNDVTSRRPTLPSNTRPSMISMSRRVRESDTIRILSVVNGNGHGHNAIANNMCQLQVMYTYMTYS